MLTAQPSSSIPGDGTREGLNSEDITQSGAQKSPSPSATLSNLEINATPSTANAKTSNEVASTNNRVLARVCQHLKHFTTYGPAIDEFYNWCRDPRAYHPLNEQAILQCLQIIKNKAPECGMWSALRVFDVAMKHRHRLSQYFDAAVSKWYEELKGGTIGLGSSSLPYSAPQPTSFHSNVVSAASLPPSQSMMFTMSPPLNNRQRKRSSNPVPSPVTSTISASAYSSIPIPTPYGPTAYTMPMMGPVNTNNNSQMFTPQYQQSVAQWQQLCLLQQQADHVRKPNHMPISNNLTNRQAMLSNQANLQIQNDWANAINNFGQSISKSRNQVQAIDPQFSSISMPAEKQIINAVSTTAKVTSETNAIGYMRPLGRALAPFQPEHNRPVANVNININSDVFQKLWTRTVFKLPDAEEDDKQLPITVILNAWKGNGPESKCEWPEKVEFAVNSAPISPVRKRKVQIPNKSSNTHMLIGKDRPLDLTPMLIPGINVITIKQNACACGYVFGISLYLRESEQLIRARAKTKSIDIPQGQRLVNKLIGVKESDDDSLSGMSGLTSQPQSPSIGTKDQSVPSSEDDEIECMQESIKINLRCPISLLRIKEPVKGVACQHVECFDLNSYLCVNQGLSTWKCPVCSRVTISSALAFDAYFAQLLKDTDENVTQIEYNRISRTWKPVAYAAGDDDDDGSDGDGPSPSKPAQDQIVETPSKRKSSMELVNLISDDENDDASDQVATKRGKIDSIVQQQQNIGTKDDHQNENSATTTATPSTSMSIPTYSVPPSSAIPFLHLPTRVENTPPTNNWNIPSFSSPGAPTHPNTVYSGQSLANNPINTSSSSNVTASSAQAVISLPTSSNQPHITSSLEPLHPPIQAPTPLPTSRSFTGTQPSREPGGSKATCSIYVPKKKLPRI